jgi:hypothetical protein
MDFSGDEAGNLRKREIKCNKKGGYFIVVLWCHPTLMSTGSA